MATLTNTNFWVYFKKAEEVDRVTCKICRRSLKSKRTFNLKQHLKQSHKIEFRFQKRTSYKKKQQNSPNDTASLPSDNKDDSSLKIKTVKSNQRNIQSLDSNDSLTGISTYIKYERPLTFEASNSESDDNEEISRQSLLISPQNYINNRGNNVETSKENSQINPLFLDKPDTVAEAPAVSRANKRDPLSGIDALTNGEERGFGTKRKKNTRIADGEVIASNKNDSFEIWAKKKKLLLEIEELEMRNYKIKLELWEREQNLRLICSKFTKDIKSNK